MKNEKMKSIINRLYEVARSESDEAKAKRQMGALLLSGAVVVKVKPAKNFEELTLLGAKVQTTKKVVESSLINKIDNLKLELETSKIVEAIKNSSLKELLRNNNLLKLYNSKLDALTLSKPPQKHRVIRAVRERGE